MFLFALERKDVPHRMPFRTGLILSLMASSSVPAMADTPAPTPTKSAAAKPSGFTYSATFRAYDFLRQNRIQGSAPNRQAENNSAQLHVGYAIPHSALSLGATYFGAYAFGINGLHPEFNPHVDNTLPGFAESTLLEAYARYQSPGVGVTVGNQIGHNAWLPASDSRLKPVAFQGIDANVRLTSALSLGVSRYIRWEGRTASAFDRSTLLTSMPAGNPAFPIFNTPGSLLVNFTYKPNAQLTASLENYTFYDIANLTYGTASYYPEPHARLNPFIMAQYVRERQTGASYVGQIDNNTVGLEVGASPVKNVTAYIAVNSSPTLFQTVAASSASAAGAGFFLPQAGSSPVKSLGGGLYRVAYGGIASPYTFNYATDPLFTTSISQGMADRANPGSAIKVGVTLQNSTKQLRLILSQAWYDYSQELGINKTNESNADLTYFCRKPGKGPYHGLFFRERVADRIQPTSPFDFKYIRSQVEYDI